MKLAAVLIILIQLASIRSAYSNPAGEVQPVNFTFRGDVGLVKLDLFETFTQVNASYYLGSAGSSVAQVNGRWSVFDADDQLILSGGLQLVGAQTWTTTDNDTVDLNFHNCTDDEFPCSDGVCMPMSVRCNFLLDCADRSDEQKCENLELDDAYNQIVAASVTDLHIDIDIKRIVDLSLNKGEIALKILTILKWKDYRFRQLNLQESRTDNAVDYDQWQKIWTPNLLFLNTREHLLSKNMPGETNSHTFFERNGRPLKDDRKSLLRNDYYENATIVKSNRYTVNFLCDFHFKSYPFNAQKCEIEIGLATPKHSYLNLIADGVTFSNTDFETYNLTAANISVVHRSSKEYKGQIYLLELTLRNDMTPMVLTVFIPIIVLNMINQFTNYMTGSIMFELILTVNATILMTLTSLFISNTNSMPRTNYVKTIDVWMLCNFMYPFIIITIHTLVYLIGRSDNNAKKSITQALEWTGKFVLPAMFIVLNLGYMMMGRCNIYL